MDKTVCIETLGEYLLMSFANVLHRGPHHRLATACKEPSNDTKTEFLRTISS